MSREATMNRMLTPPLAALIGTIGIYEALSQHHNTPDRIGSL